MINYEAEENGMKLVSNAKQCPKCSEIQNIYKYQLKSIADTYNGSAFKYNIAKQQYTAANSNIKTRTEQIAVYNNSPYVSIHPVDTRVEDSSSSSSSQESSSSGTPFPVNYFYPLLRHNNYYAQVDLKYVAYNRYKQLYGINLLTSPKRDAGEYKENSVDDPISAMNYLFPGYSYDSYGSYGEVGYSDFFTFTPDTTQSFELNGQFATDLTSSWSSYSSSSYETSSSNGEWINYYPTEHLMYVNVTGLWPVGLVAEGLDENGEKLANALNEVYGDSFKINGNPTDKFAQPYFGLGDDDEDPYNYYQHTNSTPFDLFIPNIKDLQSNNTSIYSVVIHILFALRFELKNDNNEVPTIYDKEVMHHIISMYYKNFKYNVNITKNNLVQLAHPEISFDLYQKPQECCYKPSCPSDDSSSSSSSSGSSESSSSSVFELIPEKCC